MPHPGRRTLLLAAAPAAQLLAAACYAHRAVPAGAAPDARTVRVRFAAPRGLRVASAASDTLGLSGVRAVAGHVAAARGDTLELRLRSVEPAPGATLDGARLRLVRAAGDRVEARRFAVGRTVGLAAALSAAAAAVLVVLGAPFRGGEF